jgi:site-specific recombinase XerD
MPVPAIPAGCLAGIYALRTGQVPQALALTSQVLAIPLKRFDRQLVQPLSVLEAQAILAATNLTTQSGRRDHLLFNFLYHTGARVSEASRLQQQDIHWGPSSTACLHGKGRKYGKVVVMER